MPGHSDKSAVRFPCSKFLVGLWSASGGDPKAEERIEKAFPGEVVTTLAAAVEQVALVNFRAFVRTGAVTRLSRAPCTAVSHGVGPNSGEVRRFTAGAGLLPAIRCSARAPARSSSMRSAHCSADHYFGVRPAINHTGFKEDRDANDSCRNGEGRAAIAWSPRQSNIAWMKRGAIISRGAWTSRRDKAEAFLEALHRGLTVEQAKRAAGIADGARSIRLARTLGTALGKIRKQMAPRRQKAPSRTVMQPVLSGRHRGSGQHVGASAAADR